MNRDELISHAQRVLDAWTAQDVERVLACYTPDLVYRDPNTPTPITGSNAMRRYLTKLFERWTMRWWLRELYPLAGEDGCALLWRASFRTPGSAQILELDGMDLVLLEGGRIRRNDVYFDRTLLAPLAERG